MAQHPKRVMLTVCQRKQSGNMLPVPRQYRPIHPIGGVRKLGRTMPIVWAVVANGIINLSHLSAVSNPIHSVCMTTAGNVWEWTCSEWKTDFDGSESECAKPDAASNRRVSRGGSWLNDTVFSRPSARFWLIAVHRDSTVGLRVLRASRTP